MSRLDAFRVLSSFEPKSGQLGEVAWDVYVDWAISQGLAPLAAYNLEYRLGGASAPEWALDRLLSVYQGSLNDNVMKLVNFKRAIDALEGRRVVLLGAASFAEALYPHVAFRPVLELEALVPAQDLDAVSAHLAGSEFKVVAPEAGEGADRVLFDGRTRVLLYAGVLGGARASEEAGLLARAMPMKVYGPSVYRLAAEDALLLEALSHAHAGYQVPAIAWVDLRELVRGAPSLGGPYSRPLDASAVRSRAKAWKLERALWASLGVLEALFPDVHPEAERLRPELRFATRELLGRAVVKPAATLGAEPLPPARERLQHLLVGA
jgi:hypothetical protein